MTSHHANRDIELFGSWGGLRGDSRPPPELLRVPWKMMDGFDFVNEIFNRMKHNENYQAFILLQLRFIELLKYF